MIGYKSIQEVQRQIDILVRACNGLKFDEIKAKLPRSCYRPDLDDIILAMILDGKPECIFCCMAARHEEK